MKTSKFFSCLLLLFFGIGSFAQPANQTCYLNQLENYQAYECTSQCTPKAAEGVFDNVSKFFRTLVSSKNNGELSDCGETCKWVDKQEQKCCNGYERASNKGDSPCNDIDECERNKTSVPPLCDPAANLQCNNTLGSYECICLPGYRRAYNSPLAPCVDIDECDQGSSSTPTCGFAYCENLPGSYRCHCQLGYKLVTPKNEDGVINRMKIYCEDENECTNPDYPPQCTDANTVCVNNVGSFSCECAKGFEKDGQYCKDINECKNATFVNLCQNGKCVNTEGSFECHCDEGYEKNPLVPPKNDYTCFDIDECTNRSLCGVNETCINLPGSYECAEPCPPGFVFKKGRGCVDINECSIQYDKSGKPVAGPALHNCSHYCHNEIGNYSCSCPMLYKLSDDNVTCLYGYIDDEILILAFVILAVLTIVAVSCVCFCSSRLWRKSIGSRRHRRYSKYKKPDTTADVTASAVSYNYSTEVVKKRTKANTPPSFYQNQPKLPRDNHSPASHDESNRTRSSHYSSHLSSGDNDYAPDYPLTASNTMTFNSQHAGLNLANPNFASPPNATSTIKRAPPPSLRPPNHSYSFQPELPLESPAVLRPDSSQSGSTVRPRPASVSAAPINVVHFADRIILEPVPPRNSGGGGGTVPRPRGESLNFEAGRPPSGSRSSYPLRYPHHSLSQNDTRSFPHPYHTLQNPHHYASAMAVPSPVPEQRRPVLLPRYASTDDESPIVALLDDSNDP